MTRLEIDMNRKGDENNDIIFYDREFNFAGKQWITPIYDAIIESQILSFSFMVFDRKSNHLFEPYVLKETSGRWYVVGSENGQQSLYGLDRIEKLQVTNQHFKYDTSLKMKIFKALEFLNIPD